MNGKAERRWLGTFPCDSEKTTVLKKIALRAYEGKSSELFEEKRNPSPRGGVLGTVTTGPAVTSRYTGQAKNGQTGRSID